MCRFPVSVLAALVAPSLIRAQQTASAQVSGVVQEPSGAAVPNAEIRLKQLETGLQRTVTSGADGSYTAPYLPVGPYRLEVSAQGFTVYVQTGIVLQIDSNPVISPVLRAGSMTEQVQATADVTMTETHENSISQVIDQRRIVELPLNGRRATQLILLSGGATLGAPGGDINTSKNYQSAAVTISVAGGQPNTIDFMMDGGDNNDAFSNVNKPCPFPHGLQDCRRGTAFIRAPW